MIYICCKYWGGTGPSLLLSREPHKERRVSWVGECIKWLGAQLPLLSPLTFCQIFYPQSPVLYSTVRTNNILSLGKIRTVQFALLKLLLVYIKKRSISLLLTPISTICLPIHKDANITCLHVKFLPNQLPSHNIKFLKYRIQ